MAFRRDETSIPTGMYNCKLKYIIKDVDPDSGEADEEGYVRGARTAHTLVPAVSLHPHGALHCPRPPAAVSVAR